MSRFLANLAGLALGQPPAGAARLSLPPRFSGSDHTDIVSGLEQVETAPSRPVSPSLSVEPSRQAEVRREMPATPIVETVPVRASPPREKSASQTSLPMARQTELPRSFERVLPDTRPSALRAIEHTQAVRSATETAAPAQPSPPVRSETIVRHIRNDPSPRQAAPLTEAALANRAVVEREARPVVNVTIDRIEVRAPRETPQSQTPRRAKPQPSVSLADYLGARS